MDSHKVRELSERLTGKKIFGKNLEQTMQVVQSALVREMIKEGIPINTPLKDLIRKKMKVVVDPDTFESLDKMESRKRIHLPPNWEVTSDFITINFADLYAFIKSRYKSWMLVTHEDLVEHAYAIYSAGDQIKKVVNEEFLQDLSIQQIKIGMLNAYLPIYDLTFPGWKCGVPVGLGTEQNSQLFTTRKVPTKEEFQDIIGQFSFAQIPESQDTDLEYEMDSDVESEPEEVKEKSIEELQEEDMNNSIIEYRERFGPIAQREQDRIKDCVAKAIENHRKLHGTEPTYTQIQRIKALVLKNNGLEPACIEIPESEDEEAVETKKERRTRRASIIGHLPSISRCDPCESLAAKLLRLNNCMKDKITKHSELHGCQPTHMELKKYKKMINRNNGDKEQSLSEISDASESEDEPEFDEHEDEDEETEVSDNNISETEEMNEEEREVLKDITPSVRSTANSIANEEQLEATNQEPTLVVINDEGEVMEDDAMEGNLSMEPPPPPPEEPRRGLRRTNSVYRA